MSKSITTEYIEPLSNNILFTIKEYDYLEPIKKQKDNNFYNDLLSSIKKEKKDYDSYLKNKTILPLSDTNDIIMNEYIKCFSDNNIIVVYPNALKKNKEIKEKFFKLLNSNGNIYYVKPLKINFYHAYNLLFNLYAHSKRMKTNNNIVYKLNRLGFNVDSIEDQDILIIVYQHLNKEQSINGSTTPFKSALRQLFLDEDIKNTQFDPKSDSYPRGYDYLHVNDSFHECINYSYLFLHKNTIDFIKKQHSWRLMLLTRGQELFNKLCRIIFTLPLYERNKIMLMSSTILFSYGIRNMNDIDGMVTDDIIITKKIINDLEKNNIDIYYGGIKNIKDISSSIEKNIEWENELNRRAKLFGASNYNELINNPNNHYYFMGVKMLKLDYDIIIRKLRQRPAQMTDLLILNRLLNINIQGFKLEIPLENKTFDEKTKTDVITTVNKNTYLETIKHYLKKRYNLNINESNINTWINTSENKQIYIEKPHNILLEPNLEKKPLSLENKKINSLKELYSYGKNISNDKIIYPSKKELIDSKYIEYTSILADDKPYIYKSEDWINNQFLCQKEPKEIYAKNSNRLRVLSFNVHNFITRCNQGIAPSYFNTLNIFQSGRNFKDFLSLFKNINADVICLQEFVPLFEKEINIDITDFDEIKKINFEHINNEMKKLGYFYSCIADANNGKFSSNEPRSYFMLCNAIYSKLPILEEKIFQLFINRNIVSIKINYNNKDVWILNTHSAYFSDTTPETIALNTDLVVLQFKTIKYIIENEFLKHEHKNLIFCGDFNINFFRKNNNYRYKNYDDIKNTMLEHFNNSFKIILPTNFSQNDQTDFILINKNAQLQPKYNLVVYSTISDHFPIFTDFQ
jgi:endonuclease/exonuclease/phosphatase family metal-dependent hydrolase